MSKYHSRKASCAYGHTHDSKAEAQRCNELNLLLQTHEIENLKIQPRYELIPAKRYADMPNERAVTYIADFEYRADGKTIVEDVKGMRTPEYIIKRKLFKAMYCHGDIVFREETH